jgi:hypothetical protein
MAKYVFKGHVFHNGVEFVKGQECPKEIQPEMNQQGLVVALEEPKFVEPPAPKSEPKKKA